MKSGGLPWELVLKNGSTKRAQLIPYVHEIIGDTKSHDTHCGRMGSHHLQMKQLVRDFDIKSDRGNVQHKCCFCEVEIIKNMNKEVITDISFKFVDNAFWKLEFGYNVHDIYG